MEIQKDLIKIIKIFQIRKKQLIIVENCWLMEDTSTQIMFQRCLIEIKNYGFIWVILLRFLWGRFTKKEVLKTRVIIVQVPRGVNFGTEENPKLATMLFGIAGIEDEHLDLIQKISIFCADVDNVVKMADAQSVEEIAKYFEN